MKSPLRSWTPQCSSIFCKQYSCFPNLWDPYICIVMYIVLKVNDDCLTIDTITFKYVNLIC